ncbi:MAG: PEP-CTERM sorting domain-containing protein [Candidatus Omnitrophica bacterium]|nr:PEP-CTERM sorting domain-containing protein [Candidatus Omnitrophota bacterium]
MKKYVILFCCIVSLFCFNNNPAHATSFDFESLGIPNGPLAIELYMEGIYGSDIVVVGAGTSILGSGIGPDTYITNIREAGIMDISIAFVDVPIVSMSFDWEVFADTGYVDFRWSAFDAGNNLIQNDILTGGVGWGTSSLIAFSEPVYKISFSDNGIHDIGVDNLNVASVPEPATMLLVGTGLLGVVRLRKKKH